MVAKKVVVFLFLSIFLIKIISAADIGYIVLNKANDDVTSVFNNLGLSYDVIKDKDVMSKNLNDYRLIFVDDGRLKKTKNLRIYNYPSVIMNRYYGEEWGLTDRDGISQLAATSPLNVRKDNRVLQVYTQALEGNIAIPYYYLDDQNKANMSAIARTYIWGAEISDFGDVVSKANKGQRLVNGITANEKLCFYGIAKSKYWTNNAKDLLNECIGFVLTECETNAECDDEDIYTEDVCENPGTINAECKNYPIECLSETDCGIDGFVGNNFCSENDVLKEYIDYTCNNPGTRNSLCDSEGENRLIEECSDLCVEGSCVDIECFNDAECDDNSSYTQDKCLNPGTITSKCDYTPIRCLNNLDCNDNNRTTEDICENPGTIDSLCTNKPISCFVNTDCGIDGFINAPLCSDGSVLQDYKTFKCNNGGTSLSSCSNTVAPKVKEVCDDSCQDGACVIINCKSNADCNDNNLYTKDTCVNPNTPASYCNYEPIECFNKNDCGVDGFRDGQYCSQNGDVVKDFETFACNSAGTPQSSCSSSVQPQLIEQCSSQGESCLNGECVEIECSKNSDCGVNGFIGEKYCSLEGDVKQDFRTFKCNNPNTPQSFCSSNITNNIIDECLGNEICIGRQQQLISSKLNNQLVEAQCVAIECFQNSDCNDNNPITIDQCINAGSPQSYCRNTEVNCFVDSDCGYTGFLGGEFCSQGGDDILKKYQNSSCFNPGTADSFCQITVGDRVIQDCDDRNPQTVDSCQTNGQPSCVHETIKCNIDSDCGSNGYISELYCSVSGDSARDYKKFKCNNPRTPQSFCSSNITQNVIDDCSAQEQCTNGLCEQIPNILCKKNSDCGTDGYVTELYCSVSGDSVRDYKKFTCNNPNTPQSSCSSNVTQNVIDDCSAQEQCTNGLCEQIPNILCKKNSDCGTDRFVGNNFCSADDVHRNYVTYSCNLPNTPQSYCSNNTESRLIEECSDECVNGACVDIPITCYEDPDCDDNNLRTVDQCVNAGTPSSYCRNTEVNCVTNIDCGITGYIGSEFCFSNDIYKIYQTASCINGGTLESYCNVEASPRQVQECDDGNILTSDMCVQNGNVRCEHNIITCKKNSDCGTDGYVGLNYCIDDDSVARNYTTYLCNNPNTPQSYCSSNTEAQINDNCDNTEICANGICVLDENPECSDEIDNDGDLYIDYPNDPGCDSPDDDDEQDNVCPVGKSVYHGSTRLIANNPSYTVNQYDANTQAGISPLNKHSPLLDQTGKKLKNGFAIKEGEYYIRIRNNAFSRWNINSYDTSPWGGGPGLTWESSANVVYNNTGVLTRSKFGKYFFATPLQAIAAGKGKGTPLYHTGGKLYVFIDDQPITDNRNFVDVDLYECPDMNQCNDGIDNDGDGLIDEDDSGCIDDDTEFPVFTPDCAPYNSEENYDCEYYDSRVNQILYTGFNNKWMCNYWDGGFAEKHIICYNDQWYEAGPTHNWGRFNGNFIPKENVMPVCTQVGNWYVEKSDGEWINGDVSESSVC